jgi:hypothetical protein
MLHKSLENKPMTESATISFKSGHRSIVFSMVIAISASFTPQAHHKVKQAQHGIV